MQVFEREKALPVPTQISAQKHIITEVQRLPTTQNLRSESYKAKTITCYPLNMGQETSHRSKITLISNDLNTLEYHILKYHNT